MESILLYLTAAIVLITLIAIMICSIIICVKSMRLQSENSNDLVTISPWLVVGYTILILFTIAIFLSVYRLTYKHYQYTAVPYSIQDYNSYSSMNELLISNVSQTSASSLLLQPTEPLVTVEQVILQQGPGTITLDTKSDECCKLNTTFGVEQIVTGRVY